MLRAQPKEACISDPLAKLRPQFCPSCEYDLTGLADSRCPECGCAFSRDDVLIRGWHERRFRRSLWLRTLKTTASVIAALLAAVGGFALSRHFNIHPLAAFLSIAWIAIATRLIITAIFRDRIAAPTITIHIRESVIATPTSIGPAGTMNTRPWRDLTGVTISKEFLRRGLYRLKFRHRRLLEDFVGYTVFFECDEATVQALREHIQKSLS